MNVSRQNDDWIVADAAGRVIGRFGSSEAAWRFVDRAQGDPVSKAEQRGEHGFRRSVERSNLAGKSLTERETASSERSSRDHNGWEWPEGLHPLRDWLAARLVDVGSMKSARQALWMAISLGKVRQKMPKRGEEFPALLVVQRKLTGAGRGRPASTTKTYDRQHGTHGAASAVRRIDPSDYLGGRA